MVQPKALKNMLSIPKPAKKGFAEEEISNESN